MVCRKGEDVIWYRDLTSEMKQLRIVFEEEEIQKTERVREGLKFRNTNNNQEKTGTNE